MQDTTKITVTTNGPRTGRVYVNAGPLTLGTFSLNASDPIAATDRALKRAGYVRTAPMQALVGMNYGTSFATEAARAA